MPNLEAAGASRQPTPRDAEHHRSSNRQCFGCRARRSQRNCDSPSQRQRKCSRGKLPIWKFARPKPALPNSYFWTWDHSTNWMLDDPGC